MRLIHFILLSAFSVMLVGCGGSGGGSNGSVVAIDWGGRTRDASAPSSALSAVIDFKAGASDGSDVAWVVNRATNPAAYNANYQAPSRVKPGARTLMISFEAQPNGTGGIVATATTDVLVTSSGKLENSDGTPLSNITTTGNIASVAVLPNQAGIVGTPYSVAVTATDKFGNVLAISPGSSAITVAQGPAAVNSNGYLTATGPGFVAISMSIDGVSSGVFSQIYFTPPLVSVAPLTVAAGNMVCNPATGDLLATVYGSDPNYADMVLRINPNSASVTGQVFLGGSPDVLAISGDGSQTYVAQDDTGQICELNTASLQPVQTFGIGTGIEGQLERVLDIAVQPGTNSVIAVSRADTVDSLNFGPEIISNGQILANTGEGYGGTTLGFTSPTQILAVEDEDPTTTYAYTVTASGISPSPSTHSFPSAIGPSEIAGGKVYSRNGQVLDPVSGSTLGSFAVIDPVSFTVDASNHLAFFLCNTQYFLNDFAAPTLQVFDTNTFKPVATVQLPHLNGVSEVLTTYGNPVRFGKTGLAFMTSTNIYFIEKAPGL